MKKYRAPVRRESAIQRAVIGYLRARGILCWPQNREKGGRNRAVHVGFKGLPDIGGVMRGGRAIHVEVKRPKETPGPYQLAAHNMLRTQGAVVFTVTCVEDVARALAAVVPSPTFGGQPITFADVARISTDGP